MEMKPLQKMSQPELRKKKIHQFHVSACNNAGNDRFSQCLCLFDGLFVVRKTKCTAKLQIRSIAVPFRIGLFTYTKQYNIGILGFFLISNDLNAVIFGITFKSILYGCYARNLLI